MTVIVTVKVIVTVVVIFLLACVMKQNSVQCMIVDVHNSVLQRFMTVFVEMTPRKNAGPDYTDVIVIFLKLKKFVVIMVVFVRQENTKNATILHIIVFVGNERSSNVNHHYTDAIVQVSLILYAEILHMNVFVELKQTTTASQCTISVVVKVTATKCVKYVHLKEKWETL